MTVTQDALSGWYFPANSTEWTSLLSGTGISNPSSLWLCQEASGTLADSIGSRPLTISGTPSYQQPAVGFSRLGFQPRTDTTDYAGCTGVDIGTTSAMLLMVIQLDSQLGAQKTIAYMGGSSSMSFFQLSGGTLRMDRD